MMIFREFHPSHRIQYIMGMFASNTPLILTLKKQPCLKEMSALHLFLEFEMSSGKKEADGLSQRI